MCAFIEYFIHHIRTNIRPNYTTNGSGNNKRWDFLFSSYSFIYKKEI
ncbi:hypothetical protein CRYPA_211 [uncultured Candidatus Thioglobus sp.]|nr:hypothetical protein CRYPA_211 [uncultured Candidatus Thioglobus sp.]